jgi:hypothetical protein
MRGWLISDFNELPLGKLQNYIESNNKTLIHLLFVLIFIIFSFSIFYSI